jgi:hypothetical protein
MDISLFGITCVMHQCCSPVMLGSALKLLGCFTMNGLWGSGGCL